MTYSIKWSWELKRKIRSFWYSHSFFRAFVYSAVIVMWMFLIKILLMIEKVH